MRVCPSTFTMPTGSIYIYNLSSFLREKNCYFVLLKFLFLFLGHDHHENEGEEMKIENGK